MWLTFRNIGIVIGLMAVCCGTPEFGGPPAAAGGAGSGWPAAGAAGWVVVRDGSGGARLDAGGPLSDRDAAPALPPSAGEHSRSPQGGAAGAHPGEGDMQGGAPPLTGQVVISELLPDEPGSDSSGKDSFIELFGTPNLPLDGARLVLINGADGEVYDSVTLAGPLDVLGYRVIGEAGVVQVDQVVPLNLQNGPDAVLLVASDGSVLDAVAYGDIRLEPAVGEGASSVIAPEGQSLGRTEGNDTDDNARDFCPAVATPGAANEPCASREPPDPSSAGSAGS